MATTTGGARARGVPAGWTAPRPLGRFREPAALALAGLAAGLGLAAGTAPQLAILAALGAAVAAVVLLDVRAGLVVLVLLSFVELLPGLAGLSAAKLVGGLLVLSWLFAVLVRDRGRGTFAGTHPAMLAVVGAFLAWTALSALWAERPELAIGAVVRYIPNLALLLIAFTAVRTRRDVVWLCGAYLAGATVSALYGVLLPPATPAGPAALDRVSGTAGDPNEFAAVLVPGIALAAALAGAAGRAPVARLAAVAGGVACTAGVLFSLSRGGIIALVVALVAGVAVGGRWRGAVAAAAVVVVAAGLAWLAFATSPAARDRVLHADDGSGRTDIWQVGWRMVDASPLGGVGAGNFQTASVHHLLEPGSLPRSDLIVDTPKVAHNVYLQVLAELGIVGLALFLAIVAFCLVAAARAAVRFAADGDRPLEMISRGLIAGLAGILAADVFVSEQFNKQLWVLLALGPCLLAVARARGAPAQAPEGLHDARLRLVADP